MAVHTQRFVFSIRKEGGEETYDSCVLSRPTSGNREIASESSTRSLGKRGKRREETGVDALRDDETQGA